jgi:hypothetical protein
MITRRRRGTRTLVVERGAGDPKRADTFTVWCEATAAAVAI